MEIFVNKVFSLYERVFIDAVTAEANVHGASRYFERVTEVMEDKYRLIDKFSVIAGVLTSQNCDDDIEKLKRVKKVRDALLHGQDAPMTPLLNVEVRDIVSRYLREHLDYINP